MIKPCTFRSDTSKMNCNICVLLRQTPPHFLVKCKNVVTLSVVNVVSMVNAWRGCFGLWFWSVCERQKWLSQHVWLYFCLTVSQAMCFLGSHYLLLKHMLLHERPPTILHLLPKHTHTHLKLYRGYSWSHEICQEHVHVAFNPKI